MALFGVSRLRFSLHYTSTIHDASVGRTMPLRSATSDKAVARRHMAGHREVMVNDHVAKYWSNNATSAFELGLLVGQVSPSNTGDFVLAVVPIPSESESGEAPIGFSDVSIEWVEEVAQQVDRLLPGGISVLGLYVVSTANISTHVLLPYLRAIAEAVALHSSVFAGDDIHYLALVSSSVEFVFQSFSNVTDVNKTQMLSAEWKASATEIKLKEYRTLIDVNEAILFAKESQNAAIRIAEERLDEVETQLKSLIRRVEDSVAVLGETKGTEAQYIKLLALTPTKPHSVTKDLLGGLCGAISCVAYVSCSEPEATEVAATFLKRDFVKSLLLRVSLARERWTECEEVESHTVFKKGGVIRLAHRGLVPWHSAAMKSCPFSATVHVLPDEDVEQAVKNALEILGNDTLKDGCSWAALENDGQLDLSMSQTSKMSEPENDSRLAYTLLPIVIVFILLFVQYAM